MRLVELRRAAPPAVVSRRVVVVGNGMVSHRLCRKLSVAKAGPRHHLTVIGEEAIPAYDRIRLSESLQLHPERLLLAPPQWYAEQGIELRTGERVEKIDREASEVRTASGEAIPYDTLVLATGAAPVVPPIEGADHSAVHVFRTVKDVEGLRVAAREARSAVVIGGGLLGLEAAKLLRDGGLHVQVVEASTHLMPRQLDGESAAVLRERLAVVGLEAHVGARTRRIRPDGGQLVLELERADLQELRADIVVIAAGISPRDELARAAGLELGARGGVIVDDTLRTSDPDIHAIGECALHRGTHYGLVAPGYAMADVLASILMGGSARFEGADTSCQLKLMGVPVSAVGLYDQEFSLVGTAVPEGRRSLLLDGRRLVGATAVGPWPDLVRVHDAIGRGHRLGERQLRRFKREGELWGGATAEAVHAWPASTVVCNCTGVTRGQLSAAVTDCAGDVDAVVACTGASTVCGSCKPLVAQLAGAMPVHEPVPGRAAVMIASALALLLGVTYVALEPLPFAQSVRALWHQVDSLWRDALLKQISGYTLTGLAAIGGILSLRKRARWFAFGRFGHYRALHAILGTLSLLLLLGHTGMRFGRNLNMALMAVFVGLSLLGGLAGLATAFESAAGGRLARASRAWRPRLTSFHMVLFWPLPILICLHVFAVYYF